MKRDQYFYIITFLAIFAVLISGCTEKPPEVSTKHLPTTAHAMETPAPVETLQEEEVKEEEEESFFIPPEDDAVTMLSVTPGSILFSEGGISLKYPDRFKPINEDSLNKMRTVAGQSGIDILTILIAADSKDSIQVTKQNADATIEGMYNEKMAISREVDINGSATVMAMNFVKYAAQKETLADGTGVVKVSAQNSDGGTAVTYLICMPGTVYNLNFIYDSPERAESQADARDPVVQSIHLD
jgi:hypothetical protein